MLIDTHAHLTDRQFDADLDAVISRAEANGVSAIVDVGESLATSLGCIEHARRHVNVFASVGIHPHHAGRASEEEIEEFARLADSPSVVAVGETGLDYYRRAASRESQVKLFERSLGIAIEKGLPAIVHCRDAYADLIAILREAGGRGARGVVHCFSGGMEDAEALLEMGYSISIGGPLTYPANDSLRGVVKHVPLDRILLETDCPYLAPQRHRGKRNEPANVAYVALEIARLRGLSEEEVGAVTTANARRLFDKMERGHL
jgi:TatD DNase family protein